MVDIDVNVAPVSAAPIIQAPIQTPINTAPVAPVTPVKYAGFWVRYVAYVIDYLIIAIPVGILSSIALGLISVAAGGQNNLAIFFSDFAILFIFWIYFVLMTHYAGATLGKMLVGIRVQSDTFGRLSFGRVLLRETIGKFISGLIFSIGFIIAGFTDRKRALHDMFAHSVVVYKNPEKPHGAGLVVGIIIATILPLIAILGILSSIVLVSLNTARQLGVAQKKGQDARVMELVSEMRASAEIYIQLQKVVRPVCLLIQIFRALCRVLPITRQHVTRKVKAMLYPLRCPPQVLIFVLIIRVRQVMAWRLTPVLMLHVK